MDISEYPSMDEALAWLKRECIPHRQVSPHQIKVCGSINWYPVKGTIILDSVQRRHPTTGRSALHELALVHLGRADPLLRPRLVRDNAP
jgi:hypothetical protein